MAQSLDLSLMAVTRITRELIEAGLVEGEGRTIRTDAPGRPPARLGLNPQGGYVLGFVINAYEQSVTLADLGGREVAHGAVRLGAASDGERSLLDFAECARRQIRTAGLDPLRVLGVGIATTGTVDRPQGRLVDAPYLGWSELDIARIVESSLGLPAVVDSTTNALLAADRHAAGANTQDALLFHIGFGIGGGFLVNGRIARGATLNAGQFGHVPTGDRRRVCSCGSRGCLNTIASGWAALADLGELSTRIATAEEFQRYRPLLTKLLDRAEAGEPAACRALHRAGRRFGEALRLLEVALDPARILLAGPVGRAPAFVDGAREGIGREAEALLVRCELALRGAAASLAFDEFVLSPRLPFERLQKAARRQIGAAA